MNHGSRQLYEISNTRKKTNSQVRTVHQYTWHKSNPYGNPPVWYLNLEPTQQQLHSPKVCTSWGLQKTTREPEVASAFRNSNALPHLQSGGTMDSRTSQITFDNFHCRFVVLTSTMETYKSRDDHQPSLPPDQYQIVICGCLRQNN